MTPNKVFSSKTPTGKPKIIDNNGFSIANAPDATKESNEIFERLILCYNLLSKTTTEKLRELQQFERLI